MNLEPMDQAEQTLFDSIPKPDNTGFYPARVDIQWEPHSFLWTRQHVSYARTNNTTLQVAATTGNVACGRVCGLTFAQHRKLTILVLARQRGIDVSNVNTQQVLLDYLVSVAQAVGINTFTGFEFITFPAPLSGPLAPQGAIRTAPLQPISIPIG